jgi:FlaA1/EpsC-like NDP-sugar epimerase
MRFMKKQPIAAPNDVRRYFVTRKEAGQLCLISTILGKNGDIVFPKLSDELKLTTFSSIAENFLRAQGYEPYLCPSEDIARNNMESLLKDKKWPCCFSPSDTTGEKDFEEFFVPGERVDNERFRSLGVVKNSHSAEAALLDGFISKVNRLKAKGSWTKTEILNLLEDLLPNFLHEEKGKYLDDKM